MSPVSPDAALVRLLALAGSKTVTYRLGTGDAQFTSEMDCAGAAICYAYAIKRHRPGFNRGPWSTVEDDINTNSAIEDAEHRRELFAPVHDLFVQPGDLILYPTIRVRRLLQKPLVFIGHVQMVTSVPPGWTKQQGYQALGVVHCHGPNGRNPGVTRGNGYACDRHDEQWPKNPTRIIRVK